MAIDKTKVASGPGTVRFLDGASTIATFTGFENEFIKVTGSKKTKTRDLSDGTTEEWKSGQELAVEVTTDEIDATVLAAFEAAQNGIDSVEIDWLNKNKTWTITVEGGSVELVDGPKLVYRARKSAGVSSTLASLIDIAATA